MVTARSDGSVRCWLLCGVLLLFSTTNTRIACADTLDPFDPFDRPGMSEAPDLPESEKSAAELVADASALLAEERPLDARTKLLKALQKDPSQYRAHLLLAGYYMNYVSHYRLAMRYIAQAQKLFFAQHGDPPYSEQQDKIEHAQIIYLTAQVRLNLDDYSGALKSLDEFTANGYFGSWYPGSRAWVLMKLGRIEEAIRVARLGVITGAEPGRTLNMLGILLSMHEERNTSLKVFEDAITYEFSLGEAGQPATPLNNQGEVYKEMFDEDRAETAWIKATGLPDGCEHILPSLNLTLMYIEQLRFTKGSEVLNRFDACIAQFPLRNGEEHKALEHLARGRIDMHSGFIERAIQHLEASLEDRQWFGKIGTSVEDLNAAATISLAQALARMNNQLAFRRPESFAERLSILKTRATYAVRSWWLFRRARQEMAGQMNGLEDIQIRNTDSLIEYPTFGETLAGLPHQVLERRLRYEERSDQRQGARLYYSAYLAENYLANGRPGAAALIEEALNAVRGRVDDGLKLHLLILKLSLLQPGQAAYTNTAQQIYALAPAELRNQGYRLPVRFIGPPEVARELEASAFVVDPQADAIVTYEQSGPTISFRLSSRIKSEASSGTSLAQALNAFNDAVFSVPIS